MMRMALAGMLLAVGAAGCDGCSSGDDGTEVPDGNVDTALDLDCTPVRLTQYTAGDRGWCEFSRNLPQLPDFVRRGMTTAVAEPWSGGSYRGEHGEACGECWEVATSWGRQIVMVHDLCPIEGNPLCAGGFFHFDLSAESAAAVQGGGLDAAVARRVPCPVAGNVHVAINDWNEWGYLRGAFVNHRVPIRSAEIRGVPGGEWIAFERSGGAWHVLGGPAAAAFEGVQFRLTSAPGDAIESVGTVPFRTVSPGSGSSHVVDLGVQFPEPGDPPGGVCAFEPPAAVYDDEWGGIDRVRWMPNPWGSTRVSETTDGCFGGSASCVRVDGMGNWAGMHIYYGRAFPRDTYVRLELRIRTLGPDARISVSPSHEGDRCVDRSFDVTAEWTTVSFDLATDCASFDRLSSITLQGGGAAAVPLLLDEIRFGH